MRMMPVRPSLAVAATSAGEPLRSSAHLRISSWSVVVLESFRAISGNLLDRMNGAHGYGPAGARPPGPPPARIAGRRAGAHRAGRTRATRSAGAPHRGGRDALRGA